MHSKLIRLDDGTFVEVELDPSEARQISGGSAAKRVQSSLDVVSPVLKRVCHSVSNAWKNVEESVHIEQAEIEVGLCFEGEGNVYIASSKTSANLKVKLIIKQKASLLNK